MDMLCCPQIKGCHVAFITERWSLPFYLLRDICVYAQNNFTNSLHFGFEGMVEGRHKGVHFGGVADRGMILFHAAPPYLDFVANANPLAANASRRIPSAFGPMPCNLAISAS